MHAEQAIERYGPLVMSLIWRINGNHDETADLYQEVFVEVPRDHERARPAATAQGVVVPHGDQCRPRLQPSAGAICPLERVRRETSQLGGERCAR